MVTDLIDLARNALADSYEIDRELGRGGMATVFLAEGRHPKRSVAIKVLDPDLSTHIARERFLREVDVVAQLTHPNIVPIFSAGEADGLLYYVMPYLESLTLRDRLSQEGPLPLDDAMRITEEVAEALEYAHGRDVIHRDIKPENILLSDGHAIVADFGIARAVRAAYETGNLTVAGLPLGTPGYMSPEQAGGSGQVDARSDVYSLGCTVYEMLAGRRPFQGSSFEEILSSRFSQPTPRLGQVAASIPSRVDLAVAKAMALDPVQRFASIREFAKTLSGRGSQDLPATISPEPSLTGAATSESSGKSIAVLPFVNLSADPENEYFSDGITDDTITQLSKVGDLHVTSRTSIMRYKNADKSLREIAQALGVSTVLEGSVRRSGSRVRIAAQLIDAATDKHLWAEKYDRDLTDIFEIQADVAEQIANALQATLTPSEQQNICQKPTENLEAYNLYLQGRYHWGKFTEAGVRKAIEYFELAIALDENYPLAHAGIADSYLVLGSSHGSLPPGEAYPRAKEAAEKALSGCACTGSVLADPYASLAAVHVFYDRDWAAAEAALKAALELEPNLPKAHLINGFYLSAMARHAEANAAAKKALELAPVTLIVNAHAGFQHYYAREYGQASDQFQKTLDMDPSFPPALCGLSLTYVEQGKFDEAIEHSRKAVEVDENSSRLTTLGLVYAAAGRTDEARGVLSQLVDLSKSRYISPVERAALHASLGDTDQAFSLLDKAYDDHSSGITFLKVDPGFDSLRGDPRFTALLNKVGLEN